MNSAWDRCLQESPKWRFSEDKSKCLKIHEQHSEGNMVSKDFLEDPQRLNGFFRFVHFPPKFLFYSHLPILLALARPLEKQLFKKNFFNCCSGRAPFSKKLLRSPRSEKVELLKGYRENYPKKKSKSFLFLSNW